MEHHSQDLPNVMGYLSENWLDCNTETPALVLNPNASPLDLLAWCWAEVSSLATVADALAAGGSDQCGDAVGPVFMYRLPAVRDVLAHAVQQLYAERKRNGSPAMQCRCHAYGIAANTTNGD